MTSETSQPITIDTPTLKQLQEEIQQEMKDILNNSKLSKLLEKYGISGQEIVTVQCLLDLTKIQINDIDGDPQVKNFLSGFQKERTITLSLRGFCNPCPVPGYPGGCWVG
jgi:hypothetical protein